MGRYKQPFRQVTALALKEIAVDWGGQPPAEDAVERLGLAMKRQGQREPVLVFEQGNGQGRGAKAYRLVLGRQRYLAAQRMGWEALDCIVLSEGLKREVGVIEALREGRYEPWELADALVTLKNGFGWTQSQLGMVIGKSRDFVANILAIGNIRPEVRGHILAQQDGFTLTARHLRYIGRTAPTRQMIVAGEILSKRLSTKFLEERRKEQPRSRRQILKMRKLPGEEGAKGPRTLKEWRKYHRRIGTDLRRIDQQESLELSRINRAIAQARLRKRLVQEEAREKRRVLLKEQNRAARKLNRSTRY